MTLLLPLLMLGVAVAASPSQPTTGEQTPISAVTKNGSLPDLAIHNFKMPQSENPFVEEQHAQKPPVDLRDEARKQTCFTMRSYIFEREDEHSPELVGVTKCDPGRSVTQKHVKIRARLVPAN